MHNACIPRRRLQKMLKGNPCNGVASGNCKHVTFLEPNYKVVRGHTVSEKVKLLLIIKSL